ncbi:MAG: hypothetical protein PHI32_08540 [Dysgonamonadaceae bacterium]|nr:hypothetical protein [Dysgonamonadaceae bacterium]
MKNKEKSKEKIAKLQKELKKRRAESNIKKRTNTLIFEPVERHHYSEVVVRLSTLLYTRANTGSRSIVKILEVFNEVLDGILGKIPSYSNIINWTKKCGLKTYKTAGESLQDTPYGLIVDESMMIGRVKLLITLGVLAKHQGRPLEFADVTVLDIAVAESWNGVNIGAQLQKASEKVGHDPLYVISDGASVMNKGVQCTGLTHHHDISHSLGMYLERAYKKQPDFKEFVKSMTESKFKYNMTKIAYLLPPNQRTIARFMNLSAWVRWSSKMLGVYHTLSADEQKAFSFIPANASLIDEFLEAIKCVESVGHTCKHEGLSEETVLKCKKEIQKYLLSGNLRMRTLGESIIEFLSKEVELMKKDEPIRNNSSDIIESIFGKYKASKSSNKLNGVTPFILFLPIYAKLKNKKQAKAFDFKVALEEIRIGEIDAWANENLKQNMAQVRNECLKKGG